MADLLQGRKQVGAGLPAGVEESTEYGIIIDNPLLGIYETVYPVSNLKRKLCPVLCYGFFQMKVYLLATLT